QRQRSGQPRQRPVAAEVGVADAGEAVAKAVGQGDQHSVVRHTPISDQAAYAEVQAIADQASRPLQRLIRLLLVILADAGIAAVPILSLQRVTVRLVSKLPGEAEFT